MENYRVKKYFYLNSSRNNESFEKKLLNELQIEENKIVKKIKL